MSETTERVISALKNHDWNPLTERLNRIQAKGFLSKNEKSMLDEAMKVIIDFLSDLCCSENDSQYADFIDLYLLPVVARFTETHSFVVEIKKYCKASSKHRIRPELYEKCKKGDCDAVDQLKREELRALLYCISKKWIEDDNRQLIETIILNLIRKAVVSRKQVLEAILRSDRDSEVHEVLVLDVVELPGYGYIIIPRTLQIEDCDKCPYRSTCEELKSMASFLIRP